MGGGAQENADLLAAPPTAPEANGVREPHFVARDDMPWPVRVRLACIEAVLKMPAQNSMSAATVIATALLLENYALIGYRREGRV